MRLSVLHMFNSIVTMDVKKKTSKPDYREYYANFKTISDQSDFDGYLNSTFEILNEGLDKECDVIDQLLTDFDLVLNHAVGNGGSLVWDVLLIKENELLKRVSDFRSVVYKLRSQGMDTTEINCFLEILNIWTHKSILIDEKIMLQRQKAYPLPEMVALACAEVLDVYSDIVIDGIKGVDSLENSSRLSDAVAFLEHLDYASCGKEGYDDFFASLVGYIITVSGVLYKSS